MLLNTAHGSSTLRHRVALVVWGYRFFHCPFVQGPSLQACSKLSKRWVARVPLTSGQFHCASNQPYNIHQQMEKVFQLKPGILKSCPPHPKLSPTSALESLHQLLLPEGWSHQSSLALGGSSTTQPPLGYYARCWGGIGYPGQPYEPSASSDCKEARLRFCKALGCATPPTFPEPTCLSRERCSTPLPARRSVSSAPLRPLPYADTTKLSPAARPQTRGKQGTHGEGRRP